MSDAPQLVKRFYKAATASAENAVLLDARELKTTQGTRFRAPTRALAQALAAEWDAQHEFITPSAMPLTQLAFASIDVTPKRREELAELVGKYVETDLVCHRADTPGALVERQAALWDPIVAWGSHRFHFRWPVVTGIIAAEISAQDRTVMSWEVDDLDDFRCTALTQGVTLAGSALIGFALLEGELTPQAAFEAACLDELWSLERWGEDAEARKRLTRIRAEFDALAGFIASLAA